ncbi:MAG: D-alanine--D-alanine ligase [Bacteroidales bacterium]|nr:D-alanine--D-alanine ligase [Bacteroidales bacterium]
MKREVRRVAVVYGCDSSEWEISCRSGEFVSSQLDGGRFDVYEIFARFGRWSLVAYRLIGAQRVEIAEAERPRIDKNDFSVVVDGERIRFDFAYIMQHGTPGENGLLQGYFDMISVPYGGCSAFVSAITFDKFSCKSYLRDVDYVKLAEDVLIRRGDSLDGLAEKVVTKLGLPLFVKPTDGGSSFGVTKVKKVEDFDAAVEAAFAEGSTVLAERALNGRELACGVYCDGGKVTALPVVEIVTEHEFFDYGAKYMGCSNEICPAPLPDDVTAMIQAISEKIYARLGCAGCVRVDFILAEDGPYFIEVNTVPGMTAASLVPKMVRTAGLTVTDFLTSVIDNAEDD